MRMKRNQIRMTESRNSLRAGHLAVFMIAGGVFLAGASAAFAQEITITGEPCQLTIGASIRDFMEPELPEGEEPVAEENTQEDAASPEQTLIETELEKINVLGFVDDAYAAVTWKENGIEQYGFVQAEELAEKIPAASPENVRGVTGWTDLTNGSYGENVVSLQNLLIDLGYIEGSADGSYGPNTAGGVSAFQKEAGLEETGTADLFTYLLLAEKAEPSKPVTSVYPPVFSAEEKYARIYSMVEDPAALEPYVRPSWTYTYEVFDGEGEIRNTHWTELGSYEDSSRAIDRISLTADAMVYLVKENGRIQVKPAIRVHSRGAYRPYVRMILMRLGDEVCEMPTLTSKGTIDGTTVVEDTIVPLTEEAAALLQATGETAGEEESVLRICGSSRTFDLDISETIGTLKELF